MIVLAIAHAGTGRMEAHRRTMFGPVAGTPLITGGITLPPGNVMHDVI